MNGRFEKRRMLSPADSVRLRHDVVKDLQFDVRGVAEIRKRVVEECEIRLRQFDLSPSSASRGEYFNFGLLCCATYDF